MDRRQTIALLSLGIVGAGVGGLVLTAGNDDADAPTADSAATPPAPTGTNAPAADDDATSAPTDAPVESATPETDPNVPELPNMGPHPEFLPVQQWMQTDATSFDAFDGKVRAVQFWTFGCHNCQATWPYMRDLHAKYAGDNFEIIAVHAAEFDYERDPAAILSKAEENGLVWPIAVEDDKANFRSWQDRRFWPRLFLIDAEGNIRYDKIGEGKYDEIDAAVGALIAERNAA